MPERLGDERNIFFVEAQTEVAEPLEAGQTCETSSVQSLNGVKRVLRTSVVYGARIRVECSYIKRPEVVSERRERERYRGGILQPYLQAQVNFIDETSLSLLGAW